MSSVVSDIRDAVAALPYEDWKYTDLDRAVDTGSRWAQARDSQQHVPTDAIQRAKQAIDADWLVFCNGRFLPQESDSFDDDSIRIETLNSDAPLPEAASSLAVLNRTLLLDGLRIEIAADRNEHRPTAILIADAASGAAMFSQTRVDIRVAPGCAARFVEWHLSEGDADLWSNTVFNVELGDRAQLDYQRVQQRGIGHDQTNQMHVALGKESQFRHNAIDLGGRTTRNDLTIDIARPNAVAEFDGLTIVADGQHVDNHTRADHRVGPARSTQEYRGILDGRCRSVWNGKAIVHVGADGTDAQQANHNLLLSEHAEVDAKPELEIYADEVKCAHGTTVGQLDERALFYLRSRGLSREHAERVLTRAFATGIVERSPVIALREPLGEMVENRLRQLSEADPR